LCAVEGWFALIWRKAAEQVRALRTFASASLGRLYKRLGGARL